MAKNKVRLDVLLVQKRLAETREKAKAIIMAGKVFHDNTRLDKPGTSVDEELNIFVKGSVHPYVSRGGQKLAKALKVFDLDLKNKVIADIGASTGGFTDCALQNGAAKVYAIDVGYGQLDWKLRNDPRVINMERTNARYLDQDSLPEMVDMVVTDVSFISLTKIFPAIKLILKDRGSLIGLIKPQFEAGRENIGKNGVVRDPAVHHSVLKGVCQNAESQGFRVINLNYSPIRGPEGNIEFIVQFVKQEIIEDQTTNEWESLISEIVHRAQSETE